ncbi:MAG: ATP-binding protein, partial [Betaproteobacteria bacterium]|nr:ATP-binding protein [Betaproteobacteria bacterium]
LLARHAAEEIRQLLTFAKVVHLVGPRQVGKTTLLRSLFEPERYLTLDNEEVRLALQQDPYGHLQGILRNAAGPLIIDEAQRCKNMVLAIKRIVDEQDVAGQFILAGSANLLAMLDVADSLAGRAMSVNLLPLSVAEITSREVGRFLAWAEAGQTDPNQLPKAEELSRAQYVQLVLRGGFPPAVTLPLAQARKWHVNYMNRIADRDVADVLRIRKAASFKQLIKVLAESTGRELNKTAVGSDLGLGQETVTDYLEALARMSIVWRLDAWMHQDSRRTIKNAKYHFADTGMAAAIRRLGPNSFDPDANAQALGGLFESFVVGELRKSALNQGADYGFYHWRDQRGREIDLIIEAGDRLVLVEIKASTRVDDNDLRHLRWFARQKFARGKIAASVVFYMGGVKINFADGICALPASILWS